MKTAMAGPKVRSFVHIAPRPSFGYEISYLIRNAESSRLQDGRVIKIGTAQPLIRTRCLLLLASIHCSLKIPCLAVAIFLIIPRKRLCRVRTRISEGLQSRIEPLLG